PPPATSFALPCTSRRPTTATPEPRRPPLALPTSLSPSVLPARQEPASVPPCTETGTALSLPLRSPIRPPASPKTGDSSPHQLHEPAPAAIAPSPAATAAPTA